MELWVYTYHRELVLHSHRSLLRRGRTVHELEESSSYYFQGSECVAIAMGWKTVISYSGEGQRHSDSSIE